MGSVPSSRDSAYEAATYVARLVDLLDEAEDELGEEAFDWLLGAAATLVARRVSSRLEDTWHRGEW